MKNENYAKVARPILEKAFEAGRTDYTPFPYKSSARVVGDFMKTLKLLPEDVTSEQIVSGIEPAHVREALRAYGRESEFPDYRVERVLGEEFTYS